MASQQKTPLWQPQQPLETNPAQFMRYVNTKHGLQLKTYEDLHGWSTHELTLEDFWRDAYEWLGLSPDGGTAQGRVLNREKGSRMDLYPPMSFFPSQSLNIAELILCDRQDQDTAIHLAREGVVGVEKISWAEFKAKIREIRSALVNSGVRAGDVIAAVISNSVYAMAISLAALSIGAVWSSSSCDLGTHGIVDRYQQIHPKIVFADDGYVYAGKTISLANRIREWSRELLNEPASRLQNVVVIPYSDIHLDISNISKGIHYREFLKRDSGDSIEHKMLPFGHPGFILFSSGTTGAPKCIIHSIGGVALKVKVDMSLQNDVRKSDVVFQYTTTSWVMWVIQLLNLSCSASMLLYDGSPFHPRPAILLELAEIAKVTVFGTSPKYIGTLKSSGISPRRHFNLEKLRVVTSTGSSLSQDLYQWFYDQGFPRSAHLISMSGGTDISGCFVGGTPLLPVYAGEIQCKALGMAVDIYDSTSEDGASVEGKGEPGELVCTKPFPSQPLGFGGKEGAAKYRSSYFQRFGSAVWCQGDYIQRLPDTGGFIILGRSDGVLNPSGVRFGSAEIYAIVDVIPEVEDSLCVGQKREIDDDERVLLFVKMRPGKALTPALAKRIREDIRVAYSPRHVPKFIFEIQDIPYTVNGKKCEINVKNIVCGRKSAVSGTIGNPEALDLYRDYYKLPAESPAASRSKI